MILDDLRCSMDVLDVLRCFQIFSDVFRCSYQMCSDVQQSFRCSQLFLDVLYVFAIPSLDVHRMFSGFFMISDPKVFSNGNLVFDDSKEFDDP